MLVITVYKIVQHFATAFKLPTFGYFQITPENLMVLL